MSDKVKHTPAEQIAKALVSSYLFKCAKYPDELHSRWLSEQIAAALERVKPKHPDSIRLDALQRQILTGTIIWDGCGDFPPKDAHRDGVGLSNGDLRRAIDRCCLTPDEKQALWRTAADSSTPGSDQSKSVSKTSGGVAKEQR